MNGAVAAAAPLVQRVYRLLADQQFHSGTALAAECAVTRSAVWKAIAELRELGLTIHAVSHRGYRLPHATALLEAARIRKALPASVAARLRQGATLWTTGSTNADLLARADLPQGRFDFLTAEFQSAGRGRRTRSWFAPPGGAICLSLSWSFGTVPAGIGALSLASGVCALRALKRCGIESVELKWPNDLVAGQAKLGGILAELRAEGAGPAFVVIGVGLNVALGAAMLERIKSSGTQAIDLTALTPALPDRNALVAALLGELVNGLTRFERDGFESFAAEWRQADALAGKPVRVLLEGATVTGHARGIDLDGALRVQTRDGLQRVLTGDASVRMVP